MVTLDKLTNTAVVDFDQFTVMTNLVNKIAVLDKITEEVKVIESPNDEASFTFAFNNVILTFDQEDKGVFVLETMIPQDSDNDPIILIESICHDNSLNPFLDLIWTDWLNFLGFECVECEPTPLDHFIF